MLFDRSVDPEENKTVADDPKYALVIEKMSKRLNDAHAKAKQAK